MTCRSMRRFKPFAPDRRVATRSSYPKPSNWPGSRSRSGLGVPNLAFRRDTGFDGSARDTPTPGVTSRPRNGRKL